MERGKRERLPKNRESIHLEFSLGGSNIHLGLGFYSDGRLGEIFIDEGRVGSSLQAMFHAWAVSVSKSIQYGIPVHEVLNSYIKASSDVPPNGVLLCPQLPIHKKSFKNPWQAIAAIVLSVVDQHGKAIL
jgi:hypothetical protein